MSIVQIGGPGITFSPLGHTIASINTTTVLNLSATNSDVGIVGRLWLSDRGINKPLLGAKMFFRTAATTFANPGTLFRVGIQDVDPTTGNPDNTFDVFKDFVGGGGVLQSAAWQGHALDQGAKNVSHGQTIALMFKMISVAGVDAVPIGLDIANAGIPNSRGFPYKGFAAFLKAGTTVPHSMLLFADGTTGHIDFAPRFPPITFALADSTNQIGLQVVAPFTGNISSFLATQLANFSALNIVINIWRDPEGVPVSIYEEQLNNGLFTTTNNNGSSWLLNKPVSISKGKKYAMTFHTDGTALSIGVIDLVDANLRKATVLGTDWTYVSRTIPGSGPFVPLTTRLPGIGFTMDMIEDHVESRSVFGGE